MTRLSPVSATRTFLYTIALVVIALAFQGEKVLAQFGVSVPCKACLEGQLGTLPTCTGINLTDSTQQSTPQFKTCLCDASFDFNWTTPCSNRCQPSELGSFTSDFSVIIKTLGLTCVKPVPSPSPSATPAPTAASTSNEAMLGWTVLVSIVAVMMSVVV